MKHGKAKRVTISQVAAHAGVSIGTVSNYLNGTAPVSENRAERIREAVDALHYVPDPTAISLRRKEVRSIYVLTPDLNNTFYTNILRSFMSCAYEEGYSVSVTSYEYSSDAENRELKQLQAAKKGSMVVIFNGFGDEEQIRLLIRNGVRVVLADRSNTIAGASSLSFDNETVLFDLIRFLKEKGYRRIGLFTEPLILENIRKRHDSFQKAMGFYGYKPEDAPVFMDSTLPLNKMYRGYLYMKRILEGSSRADLPDAWVASSDNLAIGMLRAFHEAGCRIPGDFGLVGFDNIDVSEYIQPPLTTIDQDREYFGRKLWDISKRVLRTNECVHETLPQNLVIRNSC